MAQVQTFEALWKQTLAAVSKRAEPVEILVQRLEKHGSSQARGAGSLVLGVWCRFDDEELTERWNSFLLGLANSSALLTSLRGRLGQIDLLWPDETTTRVCLPLELLSLLEPVPDMIRLHGVTILCSAGLDRIPPLPATKDPFELVNVTWSTTTHEDLEGLKLSIHAQGSVTVRKCAISELELDFQPGVEHQGLRIANCPRLLSVTCKTPVQGVVEVEGSGCPFLATLTLPRAAKNSIDLGPSLRQIDLVPEEGHSVHSEPATCTLYGGGAGALTVSGSWLDELRWEEIPRELVCTLSVAGFRQLSFKGIEEDEDSPPRAGGSSKARLTLAWGLAALPSWFRLQVTEDPEVEITYGSTRSPGFVILNWQGHPMDSLVPKSEDSDALEARWSSLVGAAYFWLLADALFPRGSPWRLAFLLELSIERGMQVSELELEDCITWLRKLPGVVPASLPELVRVYYELPTCYSLASRLGPPLWRWWLSLLGCRLGQPDLSALAARGLPYPQRLTPARLKEELIAAVNNCAEDASFLRAAGIRLGHYLKQEVKQLPPPTPEQRFLGAVQFYCGSCTRGHEFYERSAKTEGDKARLGLYLRWRDAGLLLLESAYGQHSVTRVLMGRNCEGVLFVLQEFLRSRKVRLGTTEFESKPWVGEAALLYCLSDLWPASVPSGDLANAFGLAV